MAATDQTYRAQRALDIVFGASCVFMLLSVIWMFQQDYARPYKVEARDFRDVEAALYERELLGKAPDKDQMEKIKQAQEKLAAALKKRDEAVQGDKPKVQELLPKKVKAEASYQAIKADLDSKTSIYNIAVDERNAAQGTSQYEPLGKRADQLLKEVEDLRSKLGEAQANVDAANGELKQINANQKAVIQAASDAEKEMKDLTADFDRFAKLVVQKRWKFGDTFRELPVVDAFAPPYRIEQYTLDALPIDYNFKRVTRFDRCHTCHLGIGKPSFDKGALQDLTREPSKDLQQRLENARAMLKMKEEILKEEKPDIVTAKDIPSEVTVLKPSELTTARVNEYCAHPRLDLFVDANSRHPAERFGCTICHAGQGSATEFTLAAHTPNSFLEEARWKDKHQWESTHFWDFPMLPKRFLEASCVKCHYQVNDVLPEGNTIEVRGKRKVDSPGEKLVRGYNLVRDNGCFGCHEISGNKGGRQVGPDLRLEPSPALDTLSPTERNKLTADPLNPPGTMRKVGPSLNRLAEKTNEEWVRKWIRAPREFRPDTKMPHFYGLSNNHPDVLPESQKDFPGAEISAIAHHLIVQSQDYISKKPEKLLPAPPEAKDADAQIKRGHQLFVEKGCLACHSHDKTTEELKAIYKAKDAKFPDQLPHFGPNLSRIAAKLGTKPGDRESARRWLTQWIENPTFHHPRTFMPITHLTRDDTAAIADWLLSQKVDWTGEEVKDPDTVTLEKLARIWLEKSMTRGEVDRILQEKGIPEDQAKALRQDKSDADELRLTKDGQSNESWDDKLKWFVGKKGISQLGCFGCHDIPGFESSKPIGTPLNDWGKKDPERLAFEDVVSYVKNSYHIVDKSVDEKGRGLAFKDNKAPYERFYFENLEHQHREGFLHQKLREPRSYDYDRKRTWDDRLRMPQFRFSRNAPGKDASEEEKAQAEKEEAEAREAAMTFILGLIAEPIPLSYVYDPPKDRLAEVKGKQILEKYNCVGCHLTQPGSYQFKSTPENLERLEDKWKDLKKEGASYESDHFFGSNNAWEGRPQTRPDRLLARGIATPDQDEPEKLVLRLTEALRLPGSDKDPHNLRAGSYIALPPDLTAISDPQGGAFANLLVPYLAQKDPLLYKDPKNARAALPPPLLREGEKVQPSWLFGFLINPQPIRYLRERYPSPGTLGTILRMPKFNMSEEEAQSLVNYFAAVDKMDNPAEGLTYPYMKIVQRNDDYWRAQTAKYVDELKKKGLYEKRKQDLKPIWDRLLKEQTTDLEGKVAAAEASVKAAKEDKDKKEAQQLVDELQKDLKDLKDKDKQAEFYKKQQEVWETKDAYAVDAYRLLANYNNPCLSCHQVGSLRPKGVQGPPLDLAWERLRPEWTMQWIANPERLISYDTPMPQNFPSHKPGYPEFAGSPLDQVEAVRDILMFLPQVADLPVNRYSRPGS